ncbi:serine/threonine-protein kinase [Planomonospora sp. ID67723]|uniref:serine/threonine-protein kinase n=1 Tax=Planomonospora sp. ID67723 TaxID=2738134 RepID=UPI0018C38333|nr:serine/threonine-protein kinase [Planomonospora sp. ID67723]
MHQPTYAGRYRIDRRLGEGGFATVWLGHDEELHAPVAIKILASHWAEREGVRQRFFQEARLLRRVDSHLLVQVFDIGELPDGRPYFVMTYADRGTLEDRLAEGPLPLGEVLRVAEAVASGLTALHATDVVHRDIKPSNVLVHSPASGEDGDRLLLSDLGIAKRFAATNGPTAGLGTPGYAAPEQLPLGQGLDARTDVYGLGALVYHLISGRVPAPYGEQERPEATRPEIPAAVGDVVMKALAADQETRWPSARAFADALSAAAERREAEPARGGGGTRTARGGDEARTARGGDEARTARGGDEARPVAGRTRHIPNLVAPFRRHALLGGGVLIAALASGALLLRGADLPAGGPASSTPSGPAASSATGAPAATDRHARWLNVRSDVPERYRDLIVQAGHTCDLPGLSPAFIAALLKAESGFDPDLSDPERDEYGIARWTPHVLRFWQPGGRKNPVPEPPLSPELSIPAMGRFFCKLGPQIAEVPGDPEANLVGLYRTGVDVVREHGGVPGEWREHAARVKRYLDDYRPR